MTINLFLRNCVSKFIQELKKIRESNVSDLSDLTSPVLQLCMVRTNFIKI